MNHCYYALAAVLSKKQLETRRKAFVMASSAFQKINLQQSNYYDSSSSSSAATREGAVAQAAEEEDAG